MIYKSTKIVYNSELKMTVIKVTDFSTQCKIVFLYFSFNKLIKEKGKLN